MVVATNPGAATMATSINNLLRAAAASDTLALSARLHGEVITPDSADYDEARATHNTKFDR
jgi:hypothetical protein